MPVFPPPPSTVYRFFFFALRAARVFRFGFQRLDRQADALAVGVDFLHLSLYFLSDLQHIRHTADALVVDFADVNQSLDAGFQFLAKPVEPAKLRSILHTAMLLRQQTRENAAP